jgi:glucose/arabinose dehydrogenase
MTKYLSRIWVTRVVGALLFTIFGRTTSLTAQPRVPSGFVAEEVIKGLGSTSQMTFGKDGRLFVTERSGSLLVIKNGQKQPEPFLRVNSLTQGERGLLGVALDPDFQSNRFIYVYYTNASTTSNRVSRFTASSSNSDIAQAGSEVVLLDAGRRDTLYHNGGALAFGNDGMLYVAIGDATVGAHAQNLDFVQGKILRLNVRNPQQVIPNDNPFAGQIGKRGEVWALGFRNPFSFAIDPLSGSLYVNDVGQDTTEEINIVQKGANYGWPTCEGRCNNSAFVNPVITYGHENSQCAITGATFYRGNNFPSSYNGSYFYGDYCARWIKRLNGTTVSDFASNVSAVDLDINPVDGALYTLSADGTIFRIRSTESPPQPTASPTPLPSPVVSPKITLPQPNALFSAGDTISFEGSGMIGNSAATPSQMSWTVVLHHDVHTHPFLGPLNQIASGKFDIPTRGETSSNIFYRIALTITSGDQSARSTVDILPRKSKLSLATEPSGLTVTLDGQPQKAPYSVIGVVGLERDLDVPQGLQALNGTTYEFLRWSDQGTRSHTIRLPQNETTYTAVFRAVATTSPVTPPTPDEVRRTKLRRLLVLLLKYLRARQSTTGQKTAKIMEKARSLKIVADTLYRRRSISLSTHAFYGDLYRRIRTAVSNHDAEEKARASLYLEQVERRIRQALTARRVR